MKGYNLSNPKDYFIDLLPSNFKCSKRCKKDRIQAGFQKARAGLVRETNIIEIIKSRRYFNAALRFLMSKEQRLKLKERSRYLVVNPDDQIRDADKTG